MEVDQIRIDFQTCFRKSKQHNISAQSEIPASSLQLIKNV